MAVCHPLINEVYRHNKVERKTVHNIYNHAHEDSESCILKVSELDVEGAEFNTPTNLAIVGRGTLKPHCVPVS